MPMRPYCRPPTGVTMSTLRAAGFIGLVSAFLAAACGDSASLNSPLAPSPAGSLVSGGGHSIVSEGKGGNANGNGNGGGQDAGNGKGNNPTPPDNGKPGTPTTPAPAPTSPAPTNPVVGKAEIEGLISGIAGLSLTVDAQEVLVPETAVIRHGSRAVLFAELQVGD